MLQSWEYKTRKSKKKNAFGHWMKNSKRAATIDYKSRLREDLKDLKYAAGYLTACYKEGPEVFLLGVRDVNEAHGGPRTCAD